MSDEARLAKAEAKAAKAKAKGLRPFYKKKRWWALAAVAVIVIAVSSGGGSKEETSSSNDSSTSGATENTISTGLGSKDATDDINSLDCGTADSLGFINPTVNVTNNSSKPSTYFINWQQDPFYNNVARLVFTEKTNFLVYILLYNNKLKLIIQNDLRRKTKN
mgnify:CR=1 FL=1